MLPLALNAFDAELLPFLPVDLGALTNAGLCVPASLARARSADLLSFFTCIFDMPAAAAAADFGACLPDFCCFSCRGVNCGIVLLLLLVSTCLLAGVAFVLPLLLLFCCFETDLGVCCCCCCCFCLGDCAFGFCTLPLLCPVMHVHHQFAYRVS